MPEPPSPYTPLLNALIELASLEFVQWRKRLLNDVIEIVGKSGEHMPISREDMNKVRRVFREYEERLRLRMTGTSGLPGDVLASLGVKESEGRENLVEAAYRLGTTWKHDRVVKPVPHDSKPSVVRKRAQEALRVAFSVDMSDHQREMARRAQEKAGALITRPANAAARILGVTIQEESMKWSDAQLAPVRKAVKYALENRWGHGKLKDLLWNAISDSDAPGVKTMTNDLERIAKTELQFAYARGAVDVLMEKAKGKNLKVFTFAHPDACEQCKRIWGTMPKPNIYWLADVVANGTNKGLKPKQWRAIVGPIHPNCFCPPLKEYKEHVFSAVKKADEIFMKMDKERR